MKSYGKTVDYVDFSFLAKRIKSLRETFSQYNHYENCYIWSKVPGQPLNEAYLAGNLIIYLTAI